MATKKTTKKEYEIQGTPSKISATSRCAVKIRDNYYTIEASEEREFPSGVLLDMDKEWSALFESVNWIVDTQCEEIISTFNNRK